MQTIPYNKNYLGLAQDDYLAQSGQFIDAKNIDVLEDGFSVGLTQKTEKIITTNKPVTALFDIGVFDGYTCFAADDELYRRGDLDNTPSYTFNPVDTGSFSRTRKIEYFNGELFFICLYDTTDNTYCIHKIGINAYNNKDWLASSTISSNNGWTFLTKTGLGSANVPATLQYFGRLFIGTKGLITVYDGSIYTDFTLIGGECIGLTGHGNNVYIYEEKKYGGGAVSVWDTKSTEVQMFQDLPFTPRRAIAHGNQDYIIDEFGNLWIGQGLSYQKVIRNRHSKSGFEGTDKELFNFSIDRLQNGLSPLFDGKLFLIGENGKGIYKYSNIIPGTNKGLTNFTYNDYLGNQFTNINHITYYLDRVNNRYQMYIGYNNGVDGIDFNNKTGLNTHGYLVYPIERIPNRLHKELTIRITTSNTSGLKSIKLYKRLDGGIKQLIRTINDIDDTIHRHKITTENEKFITKQLLVEFINPNGDINGPILHGLEFDFKIIEN